MRKRDSVSGDAIWRGDEDTHEARRSARSTHVLRRGTGDERRRRGIVRCDAIWRVDEESQEARRAARSTH